MKILNLYAGIGGNRKSFEGYDVTAVEYDPKIAKIYKDNFPDDEVIVGDAVKYLEENYHKFDFIWASPPCPSHSRARYYLRYKTNKKTGEKYLQNKPILPDMTLYGIITFLEYYYEGLYVVENVNPFYKPLLEGSLIGRHLFWSNVDLSGLKFNGKGSHDGSIKEMEKHKGFDLSGYKGVNKRTLLRNCVDKEISDLVFERVKKEFENM